MMFFLIEFSQFGFEFLTAIVILTVGWTWMMWRSSTAWRKKEFKDRVLLSLNCIETTNEGKTFLRLRTLFEKDIHDVLHNNAMVGIVRRHLRKVKVGDPLVRLPKEEAWYVLNAILNKIAEQFATGTLRKDMGLPTTTKSYTFCLSFELQGAIRIQKLRIMMIEKEKLLRFPDAGPVEVESQTHLIRVETLRLMKNELAKNPHLFMHVELSL